MTTNILKVSEESARGSFFLISGTAISTVILAISSILITRFLGGEAYGQYTLSLVVPQLLFMFTDLGIIQGIPKFTAEQKAKGEIHKIAKIIKHGLILRVISGIILSVVCYIFADFLAIFVIQRPELGFFVRLGSISILFQVIFTTMTSAFVGLDKSEYNAITTNIQAFAKTILQIVLVLLGFTITGAVVGHVLSYVVAGIAGIVIIYFLLGKQKEVSDSTSFSENIKTLLHYGAPVYVSALLTGFIPLIKNVVLAIYTSDLSIGQYRAAVNFGTLLTVLSIPITTAMLPAFSKLTSSTRKNIANFFKLSNKYTAMLVVPIAVLLIIFSKELIYIIYGPSFEDASLFLSVYCLQYFLVGFGYLTLASFYNGLGETKITMRVTLITFVLLFSLAPFLTPAYGVIGLIVAFLIASTVGQLYSCYYAKKNFSIKFDIHGLVKIYLLSILSSIIPIIISNFLHMSLFISFIIGALVYLFIYITFMPIIKIITIDELNQVYAIIKRIRFLSLFATPIIKYQKKIFNKTSSKAKN